MIMDTDNKAKSIFHKIINKYTVTIIVFLLFMFLGEKHNAVQRIQYKQKIKELECEIERYKEEIERDKEKLRQLRSDKKNLEKFAREEYLMKAPDEDVYVVVDN